MRIYLRLSIHVFVVVVVFISHVVVLFYMDNYSF